MDELSKLFALMEAQETRLLGIAHCIVPKEEEVPIIESVFIPPPMLLPDKQEDILVPEPAPEVFQPPISVEMDKMQDEPLINNDKPAPPSDVPSFILNSLTNSAEIAVAEEPIKEIISTTSATTTTSTTTTTTTTTTTQIPMPNPDDNNIDIVTHTEKMNVLTTVPDTLLMNFENDTVLNSLNYIKQLENTTVLEATPSTNLISSIPQSTESPDTPIPSTTPSIAEIILGEMESVSKSPEPDNYIYETFSPISPVDIGAVSSFQRNDHLVLAEEPPEIPNDAVPVA